MTAETLDEARLRRAKRIAETVCGQPGDIEYVAAILAAHEEDVRAGERRALLAEMEEPSDEMIAAAVAFFPRVEPQDRYAVIGDCWRAMLSALHRKAGIDDQ